MDAINSGLLKARLRYFPLCIPTVFHASCINVENTNTKYLHYRGWNSKKIFKKYIVIVFTLIKVAHSCPLIFMDIDPNYYDCMNEMVIV